MVAPRFSVNYSRLKVIVVQKTSQSELTRLRKDQNKARQDEVFGGLSPAERAEYSGKEERIHKLESEIQASAVADGVYKMKQSEAMRIRRSPRD
jgi:hypothetical protein